MFVLAFIGCTSAANQLSCFYLSGNVLFWWLLLFLCVWEVFFCVFLFCFCFLLHINIFFPECVILVKSLSSQQFKDADPLYSGCHCFWREVSFLFCFVFSNQCSFVYDVLFFSSCFQDFFFIFGFHTFGYDVHRSGFLFILLGVCWASGICEW